MALRRAGAVALGVLVASLIGLHVRYPMPYVYRVLVYQDSDFDDIHRFAARRIAPSASASRLPLARDPRVAAAIESHPGVEELGRFLEATETSALLVVRQGALVSESYRLGHDHTTMQNTFSVSKSVTSALVGLAARDGELEIDAPITTVLPELAERNPRFAHITARHLLDMRSGLRYSSRVSFPFVAADDPLIYYHPDLESVVLERTRIADPPGAFQYNNYNPPLLGLMLRRVTGLAVAQFAERELWRPLGAAQAAGWTVDDRGFERMESGFHAGARDLARFGLLYLNRGVASGRRILPEAWVEQTTESAEGTPLQPTDGRHWDYRGGWWIIPRPSGRSDFCAIGRYGQFIYVSPQHDAVIVRTGPGRGSWGDRDWTELFYGLVERL